jgi:chemosensory pili system protein ChpE/L-lysine exporter family protein LysE/ArgO
MSLDHLSLFAAAVGLGFVFNAAPGAVFAETVRQGVRGGFRPAFAVQLGSLVGDALWALLGLAGVGLLLQLDALRLPIGIAGVLYLLWLARDSWQAASHEFAVDTSARPANDGHALRAGVLLSVTNPQNVAYWAAIGSAMGLVGVSDPSFEHYAIFFSGFMLSSVLWCFICAGLVDRVFRNVSLRWARFTYRACAVAFLALALSSLRELIRTDAAAARTTGPAAHGKH